jgi:hypothetical protein
VESCQNLVSSKIAEQPDHQADGTHIHMRKLEQLPVKIAAFD